VHKEALPVLYVKNKLNFLWTLYEPELSFQYKSPAACSLIIDLTIHVQLARHSRNDSGPPFSHNTLFAAVT